MANDVSPEKARGAPVEVQFRAVSEAEPGARWRAAFRAAWPGWRAWLTRAGAEADPAAARRALRRHMPELVAPWERLVHLAGDDPLAAHFLSFWMPPRYLSACSQAVIADADGPALVRNYDLDPALNEATFYHSAWLGRDVAGMMEGIAGLADGINAAGLAVSLAFGGRPAVGRGFGVPMLVRYVLETCTCTADGIEALKAVPSHMSYNLTLVDRAGDQATVLVAPDRPPVVSRAGFATNHQFGVSWPRHARLSRTFERAEFLAAALPATTGAAALRDLFHAPPIHSRRYGEGFGTVYTALYRPSLGTAEISWPDLTPWRHRLDSPSGTGRRILYTDGTAPREAALAPH
jgi:predicted choloylglycine hydrolase